MLHTLYMFLSSVLRKEKHVRLSPPNDRKNNDHWRTSSLLQKVTQQLRMIN